tara:strand:- start:10728 stop:11069 length:342 start_codon:yes stop_codon:yes gene_type:complete
MAKLNVPVEVLENYMQVIRNDYSGARWPETTNPEIKEKMVKEFNESLRYEVGSSYIKVVEQNSVHSFIVNKEGKKFPLGAILKAASWKAPATNFARGNVLTGDLACVRWTGAM